LIRSASALVVRDRDCLDDSADRDVGAIVELADRGGRRSLIDREEHLLAGDDDGGDVADVCPLDAHLFPSPADPC
jgi:hypothetical protein